MPSKPQVSLVKVRSRAHAYAQYTLGKTWKIPWKQGVKLAKTLRKSFSKPFLNSCKPEVHLMQTFRHSDVRRLCRSSTRQFASLCPAATASHRFWPHIDSAIPCTGGGTPREITLLHGDSESEGATFAVAILKTGWVSGWDSLDYSEDRSKAKQIQPTACPEPWQSDLGCSGHFWRAARLRAD